MEDKVWVRVGDQSIFTRSIVASSSAKAARSRAVSRGHADRAKALRRQNNEAQKQLVHELATLPMTEIKREVKIFKYTMEMESREREAAAASKKYLESEPEMRFSDSLRRFVDVDSDTDEDEVKEIEQEEERENIDIYGPEFDENISDAEYKKAESLKGSGTRRSICMN